MRRWRRGGLWVRWALRDARRHRGQVLSIGLLLALGVGMYSAMSSMSVWRVRSADASFAALRMHDLRASLVEGSTAPEGTLRHALEKSALTGEISAASERLVVPTQVDASSRGRTIIVPGPDRRDTPSQRGRRHRRAARPCARRRDTAAAGDARAQLRPPLRPATGGGADVGRRAARGVYRAGARAGVLHRHRAGRRLRRRVGVRRRSSRRYGPPRRSRARRAASTSWSCGCDRRRSGRRCEHACRRRCTGRSRRPASRSPHVTRSPRIA